MSSMSSKHRGILRKNSKNLRQELEAEKVMHELFSCEIIEQEHVSEIKAEKTPQKKADTLLEILPKRGGRAFEELLKALDNTQPHLAKFLRQEEEKEDNSTENDDHPPQIPSAPNILPRVSSEPQENSNDHMSSVQDTDIPVARIQLQGGYQNDASSPYTIPSRYAPSSFSSGQGSLVSDSTGHSEQDLSDTESNLQEASHVNIRAGTDSDLTDGDARDGDVYVSYNNAIDEGDGPFKKLFKGSKHKGSDLVDKALLPHYQFESGPPKSSICGAGVDERTIYRMDTNVRGKALIINNKTFTVPPVKFYERKGTDIDAFGLEKLFTDLNYKVYLKHNKTVNEIRDLLWEHTLNTDHRDYSSFVFVVLSHGLEGKVYGTDGVIDIKELANMARDTGTLVGKPKLFFIQACQGTEFMKGKDVIDGPGRNLLFAAPGQPKEDKQIQLPIEADFLYAHSTAPGYYSWRNEENGSWFMQEVIKIFYQHAKHMDIVRMLTRVNASMATRKSNANQTMQISTIVSHLRKELYFFPDAIRDQPPVPRTQERPRHRFEEQDCVDNKPPDAYSQKEQSQSDRELSRQIPQSENYSWFRCVLM